MAFFSLDSKFTWFYRFLLTFIFLFNVVACETTEKEPYAVTEGGQRLSLELAITTEEQIQGLSDRKSLPKNTGMLFVYNESKDRSFWMKDCYISLDMIWLDKNGVVQNIAKEVPPAPPGTEESKIPTRTGTGQYVLELKGGEVDRIGIKVGSKIELKNIPKKPQAA